MNEVLKFSIKQSAESIQNRLVETYGDYAPPQATEANKIVFLLTHSPRKYLAAFGADEIDSDGVRQCLDEMGESLPREVFDLIAQHNRQCRLWERRKSLLPVKIYN